MAEEKKLLEIQNLRKYFPINGAKGPVVQAVQDVSLFINKGETLGLVGESGCGKTTLGRTILRLHEPTGGKIIYDGETIYDNPLDKDGKPLGKAKTVKMLPYRRKMQIIFQDPSSALDPQQNVREIMADPISVFEKLPEKEMDERIVSLLEKVGMKSDDMEKYAYEFSGGQRQRIGLARAMVMEPELVVADEPISALDVSIRAQVLNLLKKFQREKDLTYLFIAHDLSMVKYISDRIGVLHLGHLLETGTTEEIFENPIHPYTRSLLSAIPLPNPVVEKRRVAETYDYATSGIDYNKGTDHHVSGSHYVKCTDEEFAKWCK